MILSSLLMVINSYFNTWMTNAIIDGNISKFIKLAIGVVISMSLVPLLSYINGKFISRSDQRIANNLREDYIDNFIMTYTPKIDRKKLLADVISQMTMNVATKNQLELNLLGENIMLVMISHVSDDNKKLYDEIIELK